jgi:hypothetical protein
MATTTTVATPTDNLNPPPAPSRVYYSLGRMLGVDDFQADQDYHRGCLARALLQLCGTGTVAGLNVTIPQVWQPNTAYPAYAFVYDSSQNVQVNTGVAGVSGGGAPPVFNATPGGTVTDGTGIVWTNEGPINANGWRPNAPFTVPSAIVDSNSNVQILNGNATFNAGPLLPVWSTAIGSTTLDGSPAISAWTCVGPSQLEIEVTSGLAVDRVGRMIEVPATVCIRIQQWLANQPLAYLNSFLSGGSGNILVDVFATFVPCTQGVTPCFATQDDYSATDAFSANRMLDSFAMQLVLRNDSSPKLPQDPWDAAGAIPTGAITSAIAQTLKQSILGVSAGPASTPPFAATGPTPAEIPPGFDASSVFLARISIPATEGASGEPPIYNLNGITIDNLSRLFLYPASLVARSIGLSSGT